MSEQPQNIIEISPAPDKPYGARKDQNLKASFSGSPIHSGELTDDERKELYEALCLNGTVVGGHGLNTYNLDFKGSTQNPVPNLEDVQTGGGGLPASPYMPNPASPGPGSVSAADIPEYLGNIPDPENNIEFGSGLGGLISPSETSEQISQQSLGNYISGRSYLGSDGKS
jgi:hypothetical protein